MTPTQGLRLAAAVALLGLSDGLSKAAEPTTSTAGSDFKLLVAGRSTDLQTLGRQVGTGVYVGMLDKKKMQAINDGDSKPATKELDAFVNDEDRVKMLGGLVEKASVSSTYQKQPITVSLPQLDALIHYGIKEKFITAGDTKMLASLSIDKMIEANPDISKSPKALAAAQEAIKRRNSDLPSRLGAFLGIYAENLMVVKGLPSMPTFERMLKMAGAN
jgi:hypothetical protein